jgi:hypothetical protein
MVAFQNGGVMNETGTLMGGTTTTNVEAITVGAHY